MESSPDLKELIENENYETSNDYDESINFNESNESYFQNENENENVLNALENTQHLEEEQIQDLNKNFNEEERLNLEENQNLEEDSQNDFSSNVSFQEKPRQEITVLEEKGYVSLKGVFKPEVVDRLCFEVNQFLQMEGIYSHLQKRQDVALQRYYVNNTYGSLTNFQQIQHYYVPVIDNRGTYNRITDVGVVDIYNVDKLFAQVRSYFDLNLMLILLQKLSNIEWKLTRVNLQIHSSVQNPMSFHFDGGNEKNIKFTIFLTDILDEYNGPPVFMEGTHKNKKQIKPSQAKIITGNRGDVLISYQNGFHRKLPHRVQGTNMFLTFHFTTKYEKDRYFPLNF